MIKCDFSRSYIDDEKYKKVLSTINNVVNDMALKIEEIIVKQEAIEENMEYIGDDLTDMREEMFEEVSFDDLENLEDEYEEILNNNFFENILSKSDQIFNDLKIKYFCELLKKYFDYSGSFFEIINFK